MGSDFYTEMICKWQEINLWLDEQIVSFSFIMTKVADNIGFLSSFTSVLKTCHIITVNMPGYILLSFITENLKPFYLRNFQHISDTTRWHSTPAANSDMFTLTT